MKQKILVTGSNGQLGLCLKDISKLYIDYDFVFTDIDELDITIDEKVNAFFNECKPQWVVNCVGYSAVDDAESEPEKARIINVDAAKNLVSACKAHNSGLIYISSDYVFGGTNPDPLSEDEPVNPLSVFGQTMADAEKILLSYTKSVVLRSGILFSEYGENFVKKMLSLGSDNSEVDVAGDMWGTPTSAHDLSKAIMMVISEPAYGLFHFSNEGLTSWALFAEEIFSQSKIECKVNHVPSEACNFKAVRPLFSILNKNKFSKTFKVAIPEWESALEEVIQKL